METNPNPRQSKIQSLLQRLNVLEEKDLVRQVDGLLDEDSRLASERRNPAGMAIRRLAKELAEVKGDNRAQTALDSIAKMQEEEGIYRETSRTEFEGRLSALEEALQASERRSSETSTAKVQEVVKYLKETSEGYKLDKEASVSRETAIQEEVANLSKLIDSAFELQGSYSIEVGESLAVSASETKRVEEDAKIRDNALAAEIVEIEKRLSSRIASIPHGGNANRSIVVNGDKDTLNKFTDINLKPGANTTITYMANPATGYTDITITASGGGGGTTRSVNNVSTDTAAGSTSGTDYVYICSAPLTITLPPTVGNTNLYTVKNNSNGQVTIVGTGGNTIDNDSSIILDVKYTSVDLISDGVSNWSIT